MARENHVSEPKGIAVDCTFCGYDEVPVGPGSDRTTCPICEERFTVCVTDRFTLVENDGWAVTVSVSGTSNRPAASNHP